MKRRQDCQHGDFDADRFGQTDAVLDSFPGKSDPSVGIRILVYIAVSLITTF